MQAAIPALTAEAAALAADAQLKAPAIDPTEPVWAQKMDRIMFYVFLGASALFSFVTTIILITRE